MTLFLFSSFCILQTESLLGLQINMILSPDQKIIHTHLQWVTFNYKYLVAYFLLLLSRESVKSIIVTLMPWLLTLWGVPSMTNCTESSVQGDISMLPQCRSLCSNCRHYAMKVTCTMLSMAYTILIIYCIWKIRAGICSIMLVINFQIHMDNAQIIQILKLPAQQLLKLPLFAGILTSIVHHCETVEENVDDYYRLADTIYHLV